jgi:peroxiredoxin
MPLQVGDPAPDFTLYVRPREFVSLHEYAGKPVVLLFFPLAFSPTCTAEIKAAAEDYTLYQSLGVDIIGISVDSPFVAERFAEACNARFPVLSDFNREAGAAYGVVAEDFFGLKGVHNRAAFVVDRDGLIAFSWMSENPNVLPPFARIKDTLRALRQPAPAP